MVQETDNMIQSFTSRSHFEIHCRVDEDECHYEMFVLNDTDLAIASV